MKTPVGLVTAALAVAILLAASFLIATGTRGQEQAFGSSAGELEVVAIGKERVDPQPPTARADLRQEIRRARRR